MNFLRDRNTRLVLLAAATVSVLVVLNMNQKRVGKQVALLGTVATLLVAVVAGHTLLRQSEGFEGEANAGDNNTESANPVALAEAAGQEDAAAVQAAISAEHTVEDVEDDGEGGEVSPHDMSNSGPRLVPADNSAAAAAVNASAGGCLPRDVLNPQDLLPSSNAPNAWDTPANPGGIEGPNFLNPEHLVGINTVGQSLRNANRQIRSEPPNPQVKVSPWLQTTIEPDTNRRPLEIGGTE